MTKKELKLMLIAWVILFCSPFAAGQLLAQGEVSFITRRDFAVGSSPVSVAIGDFNGDSQPDLAAANRESNDVSILLGNGDGTFRAAQNFAAGDAPSSVAVGDFNGDGHQDLAVAVWGAAPYSQGSVSILLGNGDGTFGAAQNYPTGSEASSVAIGDFNGDGFLDLAVTTLGADPYRFGGAVVILLGNGDGTFRTSQPYGTGNSAWFVTIGDFNGDGLPDLAVANRGVPPARPGSVSILLGNGDGTFDRGQGVPARYGAYFIAVGDFNGDELPDLAIANLVDPTVGRSVVSIFLGNGDGTFRAGQTIENSSSPIAVGDFNGDDLPDLALGAFSIYLGNGDGTFRAGQTIRGGGSVGTVGDFNGDDLLDLATIHASANVVSLLLGAGDGTFPAAQNFGTGGSLNSVAVGDFNGDAHPDLAAASFYSNNVAILLGNGDGTFRAAQNFGVGTGPASVVVGDFNGDTRPDLAVVNFNSNNVAILLGNGDGTFRAAGTSGTAPAPFAATIGDFNGDNRLDLAVAQLGQPPSFRGSVLILLGNGDGTFRSTDQYIGVGSFPRSITVADFNGDDLPDLAVATSSGVAILLGSGYGRFRAAQHFGAGGSPISVVVGDFDGDDLPDLAVANRDSNNVSILLGRGDGTFEAARHFGAGRGPSSIAVGDFNGDELPDLAVVNVDSDNVSILIGNGDGTFGAAQHFGVGSGPSGGPIPSPSLAVGDFNGDELPDLAVAVGYGVTILINETPQQ